MPRAAKTAIQDAQLDADCSIPRPQFLPRTTAYSDASRPLAVVVRRGQNASMAETLDKDDPIPLDLAEAFAQAAIELDNWTFGGAEPEISLRNLPFTIDAICRLVMGFRATAPQSIVDDLDEMARDFRGGPEAAGHCEGPADDSYASAAQCLLGLYEARKARFQHSSP